MIVKGGIFHSLQHSSLPGAYAPSHRLAYVISCLKKDDILDVSVLLLSSNREKFTSEEKSRLEEFDKTIKAMAG